MAKLDGRIKSIRTVTKADKEGMVEHITNVTMEFRDLHPETLEIMAIAEYQHHQLTLDLEDRIRRRLSVDASPNAPAELIEKPLPF